MSKGKVTLESELNNWFDDYVHQRLIDGAGIAIEERVINRYYVKKEDVLEVFTWLLGEGDDFPLSEPGKRYNWRPELRERIEKLNLGDK